MAQHVPQTYENHTRFVPPFHVGVLLTFALNFFWSVYRLYSVRSADAVVSLLMAVALILLGVFSRTFALTVQDRVIRLEMGLRMERLLPANLRARANELTVKQLVALRFASDEELPTLCQAVLADKMTDQNAIKKMVKNWNADYLRA